RRDCGTGRGRGRYIRSSQADTTRTVRDAGGISRPALLGPVLRDDCVVDRKASGGSNLYRNAKERILLSGLQRVGTAAGKCPLLGGRLSCRAIPPIDNGRKGSRGNAQ